MKSAVKKMLSESCPTHPLPSHTHTRFRSHSLPFSLTRTGPHTGTHQTRARARICTRTHRWNGRPDPPRADARTDCGQCPPRSASDPSPRPVRSRPGPWADGRREGACARASAGSRILSSRLGADRTGRSPLRPPCARGTKGSPRGDARLNAADFGVGMPVGVVLGAQQHHQEILRLRLIYIGSLVYQRKRAGQHRDD